MICTTHLSFDVCHTLPDQTNSETGATPENLKPLGYTKQYFLTSLRYEAAHIHTTHNNI